ncbi:MAG: hypothetical protein IPJ33_13815 [Gammaproteobacteria bacterium]|nr:hypothetical protein [Gammaproteobacteria bacterium]
MFDAVFENGCVACIDLQFDQHTVTFEQLELVDPAAALVFEFNPSTWPGCCCATRSRMVVNGSTSPASSAARARSWSRSPPATPPAASASTANNTAKVLRIGRFLPWLMSPHAARWRLNAG